MKLINFIKPIPGEKQYSVVLWFRVTIVLFCSLIVVLGVMQYKKYKTLKEIINQKEQIQKKQIQSTSLNQEHEKLNETKEALKEQIDNIKKRIKKPENPKKFLDEIFKISNKHNTTIKSIGGSLKKDVTVEGQAKKAKNVTDFIKALNKSSLVKSAQLVLLNSIDNKEKSLRYVIKIETEKN